MKKGFLIFISMFIFQNIFSFEQDQQLKEFLKRRDEMLRSLMNDDNFQQMEMQMQKMMEQFAEDDSPFLDSRFFGKSLTEDLNWKDDGEFKVLVLDVVQLKDKPLDIKIEKGLIKIKGEVEKKIKAKKKLSKEIIHFEKMISIPQGVDEKNPIFENKNDKIIIKFKILAQKANNKIDKSNEDRIQVAPNGNEISI